MFSKGLKNLTKNKGFMEHKNLLKLSRRLTIRASPIPVLIAASAMHFHFSEYTIVHFDKNVKL